MNDRDESPVPIHLMPVVERLRGDRAEPSALERDRIKLKALLAHAARDAPRWQRVTLLLRTRMLSLPLALILLAGGTAALAATGVGRDAFSAGSSPQSASKSQYCPDDVEDQDEGDEDDQGDDDGDRRSALRRAGRASREDGGARQRDRSSRRDKGDDDEDKDDKNECDERDDGDGEGDADDRDDHGGRDERRGDRRRGDREDSGSRERSSRRAGGRSARDRRRSDD